MVEDFLVAPPGLPRAPARRTGSGPELGAKVSTGALPAARPAPPRDRRLLRGDPRSADRRSWRWRSSPSIRPPRSWKTRPGWVRWFPTAEQRSTTASRCPGPTRTSSRWRPDFPAGPTCWTCAAGVDAGQLPRSRVRAARPGRHGRRRPAASRVPVAASRQAHLPRPTPWPAVTRALPRLRQRAHRAHQPPRRHARLLQRRDPLPLLRGAARQPEHHVAVDAPAGLERVHARWSGRDGGFVAPRLRRAGRQPVRGRAAHAPPLRRPRGVPHEVVVWGDSVPDAEQARRGPAAHLRGGGGAASAGCR